ncbi:hypothetical protein ACFST9_13285 [Hymenobacter monticola]|uniref:Uncharacterized protein n=1 Tax=Hymenobacter monticola TaxID=1705399 RepID=A0ABY4BBA9_9BACT|nr:hypothetical protein [Hymenobacter monticola]UOE36456.1 hypothetical protein MTP16_23500 [Hymenobacter monticola]
MDSQAPNESKKEKKEDSPIVRLDAEAVHMLTKAAKKVKVGKGQYASACIKYFAETGLNPMKERPHGLANVSSKVAQETLAVKELNVEIGNRLIKIIRAWESNLYTFLQQQQQATYGYMELIESNILQHQVTVETNLLAPVVEQMFKVFMEANITRQLATMSYVGDTGKVDLTKLPAERYEQMKKAFDSERTQRLKTRMVKFAETNAVPTPQPTAKRAVTPAPPKPVVPASPAPAGPAKS